jgi:hypothetical protein
VQGTTFLALQQRLQEPGWSGLGRYAHYECDVEGEFWKLQTAAEATAAPQAGSE